MQLSIDFSRNRASSEILAAHLRECDLRFEPRLSERVDISAYANKIHNFAERFEAWEGQRLVGMVAAYQNLQQDTGFISNVSVVADVEGRGVAFGLCSQYLEYARKIGLKSIQLEVGKGNAPAVRLYEK